MKSSKVNSNNEIVKEAISKLKESFINGVQLSDLDFSEIQCVEERIFSLADSKQQQKAWNRISKQIDELNEFIIMHSDDNGRYIKNGANIGKSFNIKSAQQYDRDYYDGQNRKSRKQKRAETKTFSQFIEFDDGGNEFYSFEGLPNAYYVDAYFNNYKTLYPKFYESLTGEEVKVLNLRIEAFTLEQCAKFTSLTIKQVRNRLHNVNKKFSREFI